MAKDFYRFVFHLLENCEREYDYYTKNYPRALQ